MPDLTDRLRTALDPRYEILRELTGAGMSRVFVAVERAFGRQVVVKVLPPELAADVNRERFTREIHLAAGLQHPHIVPVFDAGEDRELLWFTMPFVEGESLREALARGERCSAREVARILHDVLDALAYAHQRGVVHRDIKPGNILRSGSHAVVTDFGVAKALGAATPVGTAGQTSSGFVIGTPAYMAPEQLAGDPSADHRVDIYAVGLLAYELLTGTAPFDGASPQARMAAQLTKDPPPLATVRPDIPPGLAALVHACLAKEASARPASAREVLTALDAIPLDGSGATVAVAGPARGVRMALASAAAILVAITALMVWQGRQAPASADGAAAPVADGATPTGAAAPTGDPPALTRADSLAIAEAVAAELDRRRTGTAPRDQPAPVVPDLRALAESLRAEIAQAVLDSLRRARDGATPAPGWRTGPQVSVVGAPTGRSIALAAPRDVAALPPRRVVVADPPRTGDPAVDRIGRLLADTVRAAIGGRGQQFIVVDADSTRLVLERTRELHRVVEALRADQVASLRVVPSGDSVAFVVTLRAPEAVGPFGLRAATLTGIPASAPLEGIAPLLRNVLRALDEMDRAPRETDIRAPRPPRPPGP